MKNEEWKDCEGCVDFLSVKKCDASAIPKFKDFHCPCKKCLVKFNCSTFCSEMYKYIKILHNNLDSWRKIYLNK